MSDIFISYHSSDRPIAKDLAEALENKGWSVWWDRKIPPGKTFEGVIKEALDLAGCIIVLWSKISVTSDWVKEEASEGKQRNILVPAVIEDVQIPLGFKRLQAANLVDWHRTSPHNEFDEMVAAIATIIGIGKSVEKERVSEPQKEVESPSPPQTTQSLELSKKKGMKGAFITAVTRALCGRDTKRVSKPGKACRIMLYGLHGSGKTTLIKSFLSREPLGTLKPTRNFDIYQKIINLDTDAKKELEVLFADYKGDKPSQIVLSEADKFILYGGKRSVNALFFIVDIIPRLYYKGGPEMVADDDKLIRGWLLHEFPSKIEERVEQHKEYITKWNIQLLFSNLVSDNLRSVRLLINKFDLLKKAHSQNLLDKELSELESSVRDYFGVIERNIRDACKANQIEDFKVDIISARDNLRTQEMFKSVIQVYTHHLA